MGYKVPPTSFDFRLCAIDKVFPQIDQPKEGSPSLSQACRVHVMLNSKLDKDLKQDAFLLPFNPVGQNLFGKEVATIIEEQKQRNLD